MQSIELGVFPESEYFYHTPTPIAQAMLYHVESCGHFFCDENYDVERDDFDSYLLLYIISGSLHVSCIGGNGIANAGYMALLDCHKKHRYYAEEDTEFLFVHFNGSNIDTLYDYLTKNRGVAFAISDGERVQEYINTIIDQCRSDAVATEVEHSQMLYAMLCSLMQELYKNPALGDGGEVVKRAISFMKTHLSQPVSLKVVADHVNLSVYYFARLFKKKTGFTPYEYMIHIRIDHAKYLLRTTELTVKEVGYAVGYQSEHSFHVAFMNKVGIAPGRFRKMRF